MNITVNKNKHDVQSSIMLIGMFIVRRLIKGISREINVLLYSMYIELIKGIIDDIIR